MAKEPPLISIDEALNRILEQIYPVTATVRETLKNCSGRILAEDIRARLDIPQHRISSMDGYALNSKDAEPSGKTRLRLAGTSWAGRPFADKLQAQQCVRIFTGALLPDSADAIVLQEVVEKNGELIEISTRVKTGDYVRYPGKDVRAGQVIVDRGKRLNAVDIGLLASQGFYEAPLLRKIRVVYFSTGDELRAIGKPLEPGQIYDSNRYVLHALLEKAGVTAIDCGSVADDKSSLMDILTAAAATGDVIISTGGVSVGDADLVKDVIAEKGQIDVWKIAIKPGKPLAFGSILNTPFFGLPGNPVSVMVTFREIVLPALRKLQGAEPMPKLLITLPCASKLEKAPGRQEYQRGIIERNENGELTVKIAGLQDSHVMSAMSRANCFIVLAADSHGVEGGDPVLVEPFDGWL